MILYVTDWKRDLLWIKYLFLRQDAEKKEFVTNLESKDLPQFEVIAMFRTHLAINTRKIRYSFTKILSKFTYILYYILYVQCAWFGILLTFLGFVE